MKSKRLILAATICLIALAGSLRDKYTFSNRSKAVAQTASLGVAKSDGVFERALPSTAKKLKIVDAAPRNTHKQKRNFSFENLSDADAYCLVLQSNPGIALGGKLKVHTLPYSTDEEGLAGFTFLVQSSECPDQLFSKVRVDAFGRLKETIDCRRDSKEQILSQSGIQGNIQDWPTSPTRLPLGISGEGYFVTDCPSGTFLQRSGDFERKGHEIWFGGCRVLDRQAQPFDWNGDDLDEYGCTQSGSCVAIVGVDPSQISVVDRTTFKAEYDPFSRLKLDGRLFQNALEELDDPTSGPTGPDWNRYQEFIPPVSCKTAD